MENQNFSSSLAAWEVVDGYKERVLQLQEDLKRAGPEQQRVLRAKIQEEKMKARHEARAVRSYSVLCVGRSNKAEASWDLGWDLGWEAGRAGTGRAFSLHSTICRAAQS